jgi:hypothetical protein
VLPSLLGSVVRGLEDSLALPPAVGTAVALQAVSAAIGAAAVLRDDPAPPLTPSLHTIIAASPGSMLPLALDTILAPVRLMQVQLNQMAATGPSMLSTSGQPFGARELRACLSPVILVADASCSALLAAPSRAFDGCVLATFSATAWSRLWTELAATPNGSRRHLLLQALTGHAPLDKGRPLRTGTVSLLAEVRPDSEAWSGLVDFLPPDLCQCSLVLNLGLGPASPKGDQVLPQELAEAWADHLQQLFRLRGLDGPGDVALSPAARATFRQFHAELVASASSWPDRHHELVFGWPVLARRLALLLHLSAVVDHQLNEVNAETGIALARIYGSHLLSLRDAAQLQLEQAALQADCDRLLTAIQQYGTAKRRTLFRSFNGQSYVRWNKALEALVLDGRVIQVSHDEFAVPESLLPASSSTV